MVVYYTGTGNSRIIAERIAEKLNDEIYDSFDAIREGRSENLSSDKPWVFVAPTHFYKLPRIFEVFLRRSSFSGSRDAYFAMTCGSGIWNAEKQLKALCPELGLTFRGLKKVLMPENYTASFPVPGAKETEEIIARALPVADSAAWCVAEGRDIPHEPYNVFGRIDNGFLNNTLYKVIVGSRGFHLEGECVSCGLCEKVCPTNAVKLSDGRPVWNDRCAHCMACINACPQKAIEYKNISQGKPRIYNGKATEEEKNMSSLNTAWCRVFQFGMSLASRFVYWPVPEAVTGNGKSLEIGEIIKKKGKSKVMMVTGRHVGKSLAPAIKEALDKYGIPYCHYDQVEANPSTTTVFAIRDLYIKEKCDCFLAIGGGSAMDAAKGAGALIARPGKLPGQLAGLLKVGRKLPLFIAVPTTAGTGSETTMAAVITDAETHHKYAIMDPKLVPDYAVFDPELTRDLPKGTTATTGMDALTHAVEAFLCWTNTTRKSNRCAEEATVEIFRYLERAYNDGSDMEARERMLLASCSAGYAFSRAGVGNVHAIAHTLGGLYGTPHGLANAVILPIVLEDYGKKAYKKLAHLAEITGVRTEGSDEEKAKAFIAEIYAMNERMGIPRGIDVIKDEDIPQMVKWALAEANPVYPVPLVYDEKHCADMIRLIRAKASE